MRPARIIPVIGLLLFIAGCGAGETQTGADDAPAQNPSTPDLAGTARNVVVRSAQVNEGDVVLISGNARDLELLENLSIEAQKAGAHALISVFSDRLARRSYDEVPARYDAVEPEWGRILTTNANVFINVDASESLNALEGVPAQRIQARARAGAGLANLSVQRGVRTIEIGNGLYPTEARAAQYGMSRDQLAGQFWNAVNTDPAQLTATGTRIRDILAGAHEVRVTNPNGTDVTFAVDGSDVFVNDGAVSAQDLEVGGVAGWKYLPAGEVYVRIRSGSANGRYILDEFAYQGATVRDVTIDITGGRITSITASSGGDALLAAYNSATGDGRDQLTVLDIGTNPAMQATPGSRLRTWVPSGMVTLVFGSDVWANGSNNAAFSISGFQPGSTVTVDGNVVVENGSLRS